MVSQDPLNVNQLQKVFGDKNPPEKQQVKEALAHIQEDYEGRAVELKQVASGYRFQANAATASG